MLYPAVALSHAAPGSRPILLTLAHGAYSGTSGGVVVPLPDAIGWDCGHSPPRSRNVVGP
jgi:hypothetical protein